MSGLKASLYATAAFLIGGLANNAHAALSQFTIDYNTTYTAFVQDTDAKPGGLTVHAYITPLNATWVGGKDPALEGLPRSFETYCIDLGNTLHSPEWWESKEFPNPNSAPADPIWTIDGIYKAAWLYKRYSGDTAYDAIKTGAALQLAIWEVLYENPKSYAYNLGTGTLYAYSGNYAFYHDGIVDLANTYLAGLPPANTMEIIKSTFWDASSTTKSQKNQDLIGPAPIPEPATYIAGGLLVIPFLTTLLFRRFGRS